MSLHNKPEHNTPQIVQALKEHGLEHDRPSQLADAFRLGYHAGLASNPPLVEHVRCNPSDFCAAQHQKLYTITPAPAGQNQGK